MRRPEALKNTLLSLADKALRRPRLWARPLKIHLEINDVCNLECIHCPRMDPRVPKQTGHMDLRVIEALRPYFRSAAYVGLVGNGEPFLHPRLLEIVEIIAGEGAVPSIISNATLWPDEKIDRLIAAGRSILIVSFDGGTKETFEWIRRPAVFEQVIANMHRLRERKRAAGSEFPVTNILCCLMRENLGETAQVVEIAAEAGVNTVHFQTVIPYNPDLRGSTLTAADREAVSGAVNRARERGRGLGVAVHFHSQWDEERPAVNGGGMYCPNIWEQLHVEMRGTLRFCCYWDPEPLGNVTETPAGELWNAPSFVALRERFRRGDLPKLCTSMPCPNLRPHSRRDILDEAWAIAKECWRR